MGEETPFSLSSVPCLLPFNWVLNAVFLSFCVRCPLSDVKVSIRSWSSSLSDWTFWSWLLCWSTTFTGPSLTKALVLLLLTEDRKTLLTLRPYSSEYSTSSSEVSVGTSTANSNEGSRRSSLATLLVVVIFEIIVTRRPCSSMSSWTTSSSGFSSLTGGWNGMLTILNITSFLTPLSSPASDEPPRSGFPHSNWLSSLPVSGFTMTGSVTMPVLTELKPMANASSSLSWPSKACETGFRNANGLANSSPFSLARALITRSSFSLETTNPSTWFFLTDVTLKWGEESPFVASSPYRYINKTEGTSFKNYNFFLTVARSLKRCYTQTDRF